MQNKAPAKRRQKEVVAESGIVFEQGVETKIDPIFYGIATTDLNESGVPKGEQVSILEDQGDNWLTDKGLISKLYLLLKKIK